MSDDPPNLSTLFRALAGPFAAGAAVTGVCWFACGATLGLFFGGIALAVIVVPPLAARLDAPRDALLGAGSFVDCSVTSRDANVLRPCSSKSMTV